MGLTNPPIEPSKMVIPNNTNDHMVMEVEKEKNDMRFESGLYSNFNNYITNGYTYPNFSNNNMQMDVNMSYLNNGFSQNIYSPSSFIYKYPNNNIQNQNNHYESYQFSTTPLTNSLSFEYDIAKQLTDLTNQDSQVPTSPPLYDMSKEDNDFQKKKIVNVIVKRRVV